MDGGRSMGANGVDLYWIPLGAGVGGGLVRISGRIYEALAARAARRSRSALFHSALIAKVDGVETAIEMAPVWVGHGDRGIVAEGPVGLRVLGRWRLFRYGVRRWAAGSIPDLASAVTGPSRLTSDPAVCARVLELVPEFPTATWGRDEQRLGEMWNSNSLVSWLIVRAGLETADLGPPDGGRAPGWHAGIAAARQGPVTR